MTLPLMAKDLISLIGAMPTTDKISYLGKLFYFCWALEDFFKCEKIILKNCAIFLPKIMKKIVQVFVLRIMKKIVHTLAENCE